MNNNASLLQFFMNSRACSTVAPFDVLEDLRITGLESYTKQATASCTHCLKRFQINVDAGSARPGKVEA